MKVLLLNQTFYPDPVATAQQLTDLAEFLVGHGCEVTVVSGRRGYEDRRQIHAAREIHHGIRILRAGSTGFGKRGFLARFIDALTFDLALIWRVIRLERHDVIVSFTSPPLVGLLGALLAAVWRRRSIQWLMDINPDIAIVTGVLRSKLAGRVLTALNRFTLRRADAVVVLDRYMQAQAEAHGAGAGRVHVIPPWPVHEFDTVGYRGAPKQNSFRTGLGLDGKFCIVYSGNHSVVHPLDTLLGAALALRDDPSVRFVFIGGGVRVKDVSEFTRAHGLENVIQVAHQPRERLRESLSFADLHAVVLGDAVNGLVHASKVYGVLATGRPFLFIGPRKSHVGDLIGPCSGVFHAENGDVEAVLSAIRKARGLGEGELKAIERKNIEWAAEHFAGGGPKARFLHEVLGERGAHGKEMDTALG